MIAKESSKQPTKKRKKKPSKRSNKIVKDDFKEKQIKSSRSHEPSFRKSVQSFLQQRGSHIASCFDENQSIVQRRSK